MAKFNTTQLPDISNNTHIIGLCGANNYLSTSTGKHACDPSEYGWMVSDFYMSNHLFRGLGSSQAWFTCLDLTNLVSRYGEFAHGNCYRKRKIVLDVHQQPDPQTAHVELEDELLPSFLSYFRSECKVAAEADEPILLCISCHGQEIECGLEIGGKNEDGPLLTVTAISEILTEYKEAQVCLLMNSCYSRGWAVTPDLRDVINRSMITVMTPTDHCVQSEPWPLTTSIGRWCRSLYVSPILHVLEAEIQDSEENLEVSMNTKQFASAIKAQLLNFLDPRFGSIHHHPFEAQNDQWTELHHPRTVIPSSYYAERLRLLRVIPATHVQVIRQDRSSTEEDIEKWEAANPGAGLAVIAASNYGGSIRAVRTIIRKQAKSYMNSFPGRGSVAPNHHPHGLINQCIHRPHLMNDQAWDGVWEILHYRLGALQLSETFVHRLGFQSA